MLASICSSAVVISTLFSFSMYFLSASGHSFPISSRDLDRRWPQGLGQRIMSPSWTVFRATPGGKYQRFQYALLCDIASTRPIKGTVSGTIFWGEPWR